MIVHASGAGAGAGTDAGRNSAPRRESIAVQGGDHVHVAVKVHVHVHASTAYTRLPEQRPKPRGTRAEVCFRAARDPVVFPHLSGPPASKIAREDRDRALPDVGGARADLEATIAADRTATYSPRRPTPPAARAAFGIARAHRALRAQRAPEPRLGCSGLGSLAHEPTGRSLDLNLVFDCDLNLNPTFDSANAVVRAQSREDGAARASVPAKPGTHVGGPCWRVARSRALPEHQRTARSAKKSSARVPPGLGVNPGHGSAPRVARAAQIHPEKPRYPSRRP